MPGATFKPRSVMRALRARDTHTREIVSRVRAERDISATKLSPSSIDIRGAAEGLRKLTRLDRSPRGVTVASTQDTRSAQTVPTHKIAVQDLSDVNSYDAIWIEIEQTLRDVGLWDDNDLVQAHFHALRIGRNEDDSLHFLNEVLDVEGVTVDIATDEIFDVKFRLRHDAIIDIFAKKMEKAATLKGLKDIVWMRTNTNISSSDGISYATELEMAEHYAKLDSVYRPEDEYKAKKRLLALYFADPSIEYGISRWKDGKLYLYIGKKDAIFTAGPSVVHTHPDVHVLPSSGDFFTIPIGNSTEIWSRRSDGVERRAVITRIEEMVYRYDITEWKNEKIATTYHGIGLFVFKRYTIPMEHIQRVIEEGDPITLDMDPALYEDLNGQALDSEDRFPVWLVPELDSNSTLTDVTIQVVSGWGRIDRITIPLSSLTSDQPNDNR